MTRAKLYTLLLAAGVVAVSILVRVPLCTNDVQRSDSADYLRSVREGALGAYLGTNAVSFPRFVSLLRDPALTGGHPWNYLNRRGDALALRHFHVPLGYYASAVAASFDAPDRVHRVIPAVTGVLLAVLVLFLMRRLGAGQLLSGLTALAVSVNPRFALTTCQLSPHPWFILAALLFLDRYQVFLETGRRAALLASAVALGAAFAAMELAPALVVAAIPATFIAHPEWLRTALHPRRWWREAVAPAVLFLAVLFAAWPGGFLRGGYFISYGTFVAQALFERGALFPPLTAAGTYRRLFDSDPLLLAVSVAGIVLLAAVLLRRRAPRSVSIFGLYAVVAFVANAGNGFMNSTYAAEVIVFLLLTAGIALHYSAGSLALRYRPAAAVAALLVVGLCGFEEVRRGPVHTAPVDALELALKDLPTLVPRGSTVLVNRDQETYAAYLPQYRIEPTASESSPEPAYPRLAGTPRYLAFDTGPLAPAAIDTIRKHYSEVARFPSARGASDIVLWRREEN